jgi:quinol monooxygenase YgiN
MFARIFEFLPKMEKKNEFVTTVKNEVLPILKKQTGFLEFLPFVPENTNEKWVAISLWNDRKDFERYEKQWLNKVEEIVRPYLTTTIIYRHYNLETTLCEHFERTMVA